METFDIIVIGGGIAGASVGYALAERGSRVLLLERENQPGYHSTGRSAAVYTQAYGNAVIRGLTVAGRGFFDRPPKGFAEHPLLTSRGVMFVGHDGEMELLRQAAAEAQRFVPSARLIGAEEARSRVPVLRRSYVAGAVFEPEARDIDVHALHQGFLRGLKTASGRIQCAAEARALDNVGGLWQVETKLGTFQAEVVVNAAGAWSDDVAKLAGASSVGLVPKRRTVIVFGAPSDMEIDPWPVVIGVAEDFYFKPDAGRLVGSPADETPTPPCDAQPEDLDVAVAVDRIERATEMEIRRIEHKWAGLRSFVADKSPVVGFDPLVEGFFWLAGQGGYGIQTSPALSRLAAALVLEGRIPSEMEDLGITSAALSPSRAALRIDATERQGR